MNSWKSQDTLWGCFHCQANTSIGDFFNLEDIYGYKHPKADTKHNKQLLLFTI